MIWTGDWLAFLAAGGLIGGLAAWWLVRRRLHAWLAAERARNEVRVDALERSLAACEQARDAAVAERNRLSGDKAALEARCERIEPLEAAVAAREGRLAEAQETMAAQREQLSRLDTELAKEREQSAEKLAALQSARQEMTEQFKNLANEILEDKSRRFTDQNREHLGRMLNPLRDQIREFAQKVDTTYDKEARDRVSLFHEITRLRELNAQISAEAHNLTRALKGETKTQGAWGELVLERVLEKSGLERGREYETQVSLEDGDGKRFVPDVIVHLPEGKDVIVDAKVSLTAYERYCSAGEDGERDAALAQHVTSIRNHVRALSGKDYQALRGLKSLDFVLMFVPVEAAFMDALRRDPGLYDHALGHNIGLVTPSTLLATLRTIENIWRYENQNRNAQEIARRAGAMHDKFVLFVGEMDKLGSKLSDAQSSFDIAYRRLSTGRDNLVRASDGIRKLGAAAGKQLPDELVDGADDGPDEHRLEDDRRADSG